MAASKGTNVYNRQNWEDSEFPILCQTCLGANPYVRMMREKYGKECKICTRPFTVFKWCPGAKMRYKKTEICQTCSKVKNICQTCLFDLDYGLPVQVRDEVLRRDDKDIHNLNKEVPGSSKDLTEALPRSAVNREFYLQQVDSKLAETDGTVSMIETGAGKMISSAKHDLLTRMARTTPYYKRNRPHICSFWVKGECKRGEECPYRHDRPTDPDDPLADQNIRDRYYGVNDPVAKKIINQSYGMPKMDDPPADEGITTLYLGNLDESTTVDQIKEKFMMYGEIVNIHHVQRSNLAFIQFARRGDAEHAMKSAYNKTVINDKSVVIRWGRSQEGMRNGKSSSFPQGEEGFIAPPKIPVPGLPSALPPGGLSNTNNPDYFGLAAQHPPPFPPLPPTPQAGWGYGGPQPPFAPQIPNTTPYLNSYGMAQQGGGVGQSGQTPTMMPHIFYPSQNPGRMGSTPMMQQQPPQH